MRSNTARRASGYADSGVNFMKAASMNLRAGDEIHFGKTVVVFEQ
jgi:hypothetical protein